MPVGKRELNVGLAMECFSYLAAEKTFKQPVPRYPCCHRPARNLPPVSRIAKRHASIRPGQWSLYHHTRYKDADRHGIRAVRHPDRLDGGSARWLAAQ